MLPDGKSSTLATAAITLLATALIAGSASAAPAATADTDVTFTNGAVTLRGTLIAPAVATADRPGVVLVAGAGARNRNAYRQQAEALARAGIVALIYDKREGYSRATSSFTDLADDAVAGVELLRKRPGVDPRAVGLWGHSEGGWVAPLAASRSSAVGFVVAAAGSGLAADRTQAWSNRTQLAVAGVSPTLHGPLGVNLTRMLVAAGLFGDVGHDPLATLQRVHQPLLAIFGDHDLSTPPGESLRLFQQALDRGGNSRYTLEVLDDANHNMQPSRDGLGTDSSTSFAPGYLDLVISWIDGLAVPHPAPHADAAPGQRLVSAPLAPLAWYEGVPFQLAALALLLLTFLAYPVGALVRRIRGRRAVLPAPWAARLLVSGGIVTVLGTATYLFVLVASGAIAHGPVLLGRPVAWLVLQLLTVAVLAATGVIAWRWWRVRGSAGLDRARLVLLLTGGVLFAPWSIYWGLLAV